MKPQISYPRATEVTQCLPMQSNKWLSQQTKKIKATIQANHNQIKDAIISEGHNTLLTVIKETNRQNKSTIGE